MWVTTRLGAHATTAAAREGEAPADLNPSFHFDFNVGVTSRTKRAISNVALRLIAAVHGPGAHAANGGLVGSPSPFVGVSSTSQKSKNNICIGPSSPNRLSLKKVVG